MDQDIFFFFWKQMRGTLKSWWGKLADDDFELIGGQKDKLIGWIQEHYGQTREQAQYEVERRMKEYGDTKGGRTGYGMSDATKAAGEQAAKAQELGAAAIMGTASTYRKEKEYENLTADFIAFLRHYPVQTLLVGVGLGYVLARSTRG